MTLRDVARQVGTGVAAATQRSRRAPKAAAIAWLVIAASCLTRFAAAELPQFERIRILETPRAIADAELTNQDGKAFRLSALHGKVAFVLFGYTNCPDVCPLSIERLRQVHDSGGIANDHVAYVMISVDGERDTPAAMKAFVAKYSTDFIGLTAAPSRVDPIATEFSANFFKGGRIGQSSNYNVMHSPQIFVLDPAGRLRAEAYGASNEAMAGLARALLAESK